MYSILHQKQSYLLLLILNTHFSITSRCVVSSFPAVTTSVTLYATRVLVATAVEVCPGRALVGSPHWNCHVHKTSQPAVTRVAALSTVENISAPNVAIGTNVALYVFSLTFYCSNVRDMRLQVVIWVKRVLLAYIVCQQNQILDKNDVVRIPW